MEVFKLFQELVLFFLLMILLMEPFNFWFKIDFDMEQYQFFNLI